MANHPKRTLEPMHAVEGLTEQAQGRVLRDGPFGD